MQRHPAFSKLHRYLLTAALAGFIPAAMAHAQTDIADVSLPDAPVPRQSTAPATQPASSSTPANADDQQQKKQLTSDEVLQQEVKQRAFGVMPMFQTVSLANSKNIPPLRPKQKFRLMLKSTTDPFIFAQGAVLSGIGQARDTNSGTKTVIDPIT